jgi:uroporphyrinogen-III decarboxylase
MQILAEIELEVLQKLQADVVALDASTAAWSGQPAAEGVERTLFRGTKVYFPPATRIAEESDGSWTLLQAGAPSAKMPKDGLYFDFVLPTRADKALDPDAFQPPSTVPDEVLDALRRRAEFLYESTDKAILGWGAGLNLIGLSMIMASSITQGNLDQWMVMLMTEKETAHEMMGRYVEAVIACLRLYHQAVGDRCFAWGIASDDAGTQRGEFLGPELFAEMIAPHYQRLCNWVHAHTNWKTFLHSCGSIYRFLPPWIEAGIDILNPVQISAANMTPERLKSQFGEKLIFWGGGCDTQKILPLGTPEEVRAHVRRNIEVLGRGGGFVFAQVHNIQENVPLENVLAMFEAAQRFGRYDGGTG